MAVTNLKNINPTFWIPPIYTANYRITVERLDGTIDDITDLATSFRFTDGVTDGIGSFEFAFPNPNETYTGVYTGSEIVRLYIEYATGTPSTIRFLGRIEKPSYKENYVVCSGRSESLFLADITVTKQYSAVPANQIVLDLISSYGASRFTTANVEDVVVPLSFDWRQKDFLQVMFDICTASGASWYVDSTRDVNFFERGSRDNTDEAIVHDQNLVEVSDFAVDVAQVKNRIIVMGKDEGGVQVIHTEEDAASQTLHGVKEFTYQDDNILEYEAAVETALFYKEAFQNPPVVGEVKGVMLATIQPGERIRLSAPYDNIIPGFYEIIKYEHSLDEEGLWTEVTVNKEPTKLSQVVSRRVQAENRSQDASSNPHEMRFSYVFPFDVDNGTHSSTEITEGRLQVSSGSSGTWTSPARGTDSNVTQVYLNVAGDNLSLATFEISANGGTSYETLTPKTLLTLSTALGSSLVIRVNLLDAAATVDGLSVLYTLEG